MAAFTTIAAGVGVASSLGGGLMSFNQSKQAAAAAADAQRKSDKLMKEARERAETNFYEGLNVRMDAFGEQYRQNLANQTQQIEALQDADPRLLAAGIGKVAGAGTEAAEKGNIQISDVNLNVFGTEYPRLVPSTWLILGLYLGQVRAIVGL